MIVLEQAPAQAPATALRHWGIRCGFFGASVAVGVAAIAMVALDYDL
jgi:hypothetical protein